MLLLLLLRLLLLSQVGAGSHASAFLAQSTCTWVRPAAYPCLEPARAWQQCHPLLSFPHMPLMCSANPRFVSSHLTSSYLVLPRHPSPSLAFHPPSTHCPPGLFEDEHSAAVAYDRALVRLRGLSAATNFMLADYKREKAEYHQRMQASGVVQRCLPGGDAGLIISTMFLAAWPCVWGSAQHAE